MDDITNLRIIATVLSFVCFIGIILWTLDRRKTRRFEEASRLPFLDE
jgi:cytochrome c oxidase cbb3-type subunit 4